MPFDELLPHRHQLPARLHKSKGDHVSRGPCSYAGPDTHLQSRIGLVTRNGCSTSRHDGFAVFALLYRGFALPRHLAMSLGRAAMCHCSLPTSGSALRGSRRRPNRSSFRAQIGLLHVGLMGWRGRHCGHQAAVGVHANVRFMPKANDCLIGMVHSGVALAFIVLSRALAAMIVHRRAASIEQHTCATVRVDLLEDSRPGSTLRACAEVQDGRSSGAVAQLQPAKFRSEAISTVLPIAGSLKANQFCISAPADRLQRVGAPRPPRGRTARNLQHAFHGATVNLLEKDSRRVVFPCRVLRVRKKGLAHVSTFAGLSLTDDRWNCQTF